MLKFLLSLIYQFSKIKRGEYPLSVLYYHHVFEKKESYHPDEITANQFEKQIDFLTRHFNILSLEVALQHIKNKTLPKKSIVLTFDDGYVDNYSLAAPILEKYNCPATFFIATEGIDKGMLWNDIIEQSIKNTTKTIIDKNIIGKEIAINTQKEKISAFKELSASLKFEPLEIRTSKIKLLVSKLNVEKFERTIMTKQQITELYTRGFTIGAHSHTHTILSNESNKNSEFELSKSKNILESIIGTSVDYLAFPNGLYKRDFQTIHCNLAKKVGFKAAFSTNDGGCISTTSSMIYPRFMTYRKTLPLLALSIASISGEG